ncbi:hypothetical protein BaRGS_00032309 [Batillaria attramentaria]|uniref:Cytochrome P450 n=1 Tax=Batillaria attramentaria TaxID=370345 RepID=A0ABD0JNR4_9CAEN
MLDTFGVFAAVFLMALVVAILWYYRTSRKVSTVPGLSPSGQDGNLSDVGKAGNLHEFLIDLHGRFGPIASFWWEKQFTVSIASPDLFKEQQNVFDRPPLLFQMLTPLVTKHSIQFANGEDGRSRRRDYDRAFNANNLSIHYEELHETAYEIADKWAKLGPEDHIPLGEHMCLFAVKAVLVTLLGDTFKSEKEALNFKHNFDVVWNEMEKRLGDPTIPDENSPRGQYFKKAMDNLREIVGKAVKEREPHGAENRDFLLIDAILVHHEGDEEKKFADVFSYMIAGLHTTGNLLTWAIYFVAKNPDMQEQLYEEIKSQLGKTDRVTHDTISRLKYLRWVLNEALRCGVVATYAARYVPDKDHTLGGHLIPKGTPVIHALGVLLKDKKYWPDPEKFDPERFSPKNSKGRPAFAFSPYGVGGQRQCPGYRFAYVEASILLATIIQRFSVSLVPGQTVVPRHGFVTHPAEEVWVKVTKRS